MDHTAVVVIACAAPAMRRILAANLQAEALPTTEAATTSELLDLLAGARPAAVVLDPDLFRGRDDEICAGAALRMLALPVLVLSTEPGSRRFARDLGGAPFCRRPDEVERICTTVRGLVEGIPVPAYV